MRRRVWCCAFLFVLASCDEESTPTDGGGGGSDGSTIDGGGAGDAGPPCASDPDCDDGVSCNGAETCDAADPAADARGCVPGETTCAAGETCDVATDSCSAVDCSTPDADGDGHDHMACGGDDCDDADANRYPGNTEVCDTSDHDEDCDPGTFGVRDADGDGVADAACCNEDSSGTRTCGTDCNDASAAANPGQPEVCDGMDNDCDEGVDENVERSFFPDVDEDGFGDATATATTACNPPPGMVENMGDCDDQNPQAHSTSDPELCDDADNDCDDIVDEDTSDVNWYLDVDMDMFGDVDDAAPVLSCAPVAGRVPNNQDCDDSVASVNPSASEVCNGVDDNCQAGVDEGLRIACYPDGDGDGYAASGASPTDRCACQTDETMRQPVDALTTDCDDVNPGRNPSEAEVCNGVDDNCQAGVDELWPTLGDACDNPADADECDDGIVVCMGSTAIGCNDDASSIPETCNGRDDDCDGPVDEGNPGSGAQCGTDQGTCTFGSINCVSGGLMCTGGTTPRSEACGGSDEDCDGTSDEGFTCRYASPTQTRICTTCGSSAAPNTNGSQTCTSSCSWGSCRASEACNYCDDDGDGTWSDDVSLTMDPAADEFVCSGLTLNGDATCGGDVVITHNAGVDGSAGSARLAQTYTLGFGPFTLDARATVQPRFNTDAPNSGWGIFIYEAGPGSGFVGPNTFQGVPANRNGYAVQWVWRGDNQDRVIGRHTRVGDTDPEMARDDTVTPDLNIGSFAMNQFMRLQITPEDPNTAATELEVCMWHGPSIASLEPLDLSGSITRVCCTTGCPFSFQVGQQVRVGISSGNGGSAGNHALAIFNASVTELNRQDVCY